MKFNQFSFFPIIVSLQYLKKSTLVTVLRNIFHMPCNSRGFPGSAAGKESACNAGDPGFIHGLERSPGESIGYPLQYSWACLVAQLVKKSACNAGNLGLIQGFRRPPGEGNGYPLQYSGLENSMDCAVHGVTKSQE